MRFGSLILVGKLKNNLNIVGTVDTVFQISAGKVVASILWPGKVSRPKLLFKCRALRTKTFKVF